MAKKGLGRGFETLIPNDLFDEEFDPTAKDDQRVSDLRQIKLSDIATDPDQPRKRFEEPALQELAESIKLHGVLQPIVVTPKGAQFEIIAGERRYRASVLAGLETIPALVRSVSDQQKLEVALIENLQRRDLNAIETATAYAKLRDQFGLTLDEIGQVMGGRSVSGISNTLRLVRLPKPVQQAIVEGKLTEGQARPLVDFDAELVLDLLPIIISQEWSARRVEAAIRHMKEQGGKKISEPKKASPYMQQATALSERYHAPVTVKQTKNGNGRIVIDFKSQADFDRITKALL